MISGYLKKLGFTDKECQVYLVLAEMGVQPASVVARKSKLDRVTTYKTLKKMADRGFVKTYFQNGIQSFGIESFETIEQYLKDQVGEYAGMLDQFPTAVNVLKSLHAEEQFLPKLQIFEGQSGLKSCFRDLVFEAGEQNIKQIRMLTSNTFDERLGDVPLSKFVRELFSDIRKKKIDMEIYEASGTLIPERLGKVAFNTVDPSKLPAARGATNIFLVGDTVYLACYKRSQIALKIKQPEISQIFHFLFDLMGKMRVQS